MNHLFLKAGWQDDCFSFYNCSNFVPHSPHTKAVLMLGVFFVGQFYFGMVYDTIKK
jgi:hypothetical protein